MRFFPLIIFFFLISNCSKHKTVFICGDHICVNKAEAEQYFEENLSIEVKILDKKIKKEVNLVELNLTEQKNQKNKVNIFAKKNIDKDLRVLSNDEVNEIKNNVKSKKKQKKIVKKIIEKDNQILNKKEKNQKFIKVKKTDKSQKKLNKDVVNKKNIDVFDVCTILKKCSIDEISRYLIKEGKKKDFPDIMARQ